MQPLLKTFKLTKDYGNQKGAFNVSVEINPGEIVGFIGPNGAGKTTTMLMLIGFIKPTLGSFSLFGDDNITHRNIHMYMNRLGILMSDVAYNKNEKVRTILDRNSDLLDKNFETGWINLAKYFDLDIESRFGDLSLGNKKKVGIINSIMHSPELLIMDEPTSGLDPLIQQKFLQKIKKIKENEGSVLLSSHVLSEVQNVCDRIIMIKDGNIIIEDTTKNILDQALSVFRIPASHNGLLEELLKQDFVDKHSQLLNEVEVFTNDREQIIKYLTSKNIFDYYIEKPNLEDTFLTQY